MVFQESILIEDELYRDGQIALRNALVISSYILLSLALLLLCFGLYGFKIAYGRFSYESVITVFSVSAHIAWFLFGIAVFPSALLALYGASLDYNSANFVIITLILVHYAYRSFIYAYSIKGGKRVPFHLFALGFCNNFFQGFLQSTWHFMFAFYPIDWINQLSSVIGLLLFATGMFIHVKSDGILQRLRRRHDKGYKLPRGFLFELITAPNYFGECVEWIGFAMFAWTLPALSHACFVIALLLPRALQYHRWYIRKFDDYPKQRKAIIPMLL